MINSNEKRKIFLIKKVLIDIYFLALILALFLVNSREFTSIDAIEENAFSINQTNSNFVDFIRPEINYKSSNGEIDNQNKKIEIVFDVTDKFYDKENDKLTIDDLSILINNEKPNWNQLTKTLTYSDSTLIKNVVAYTENDETLAELSETGEKEKVIGRRYTLTISGIDSNKKDKDVVTVIFPANKIIDENGRGNLATSFSVDIEKYENSKIDTENNLPSWKKTDENIKLDFSNENSNNVAQINITGYANLWSDNQRELNANDIIVYVDGKENNSVKVEVGKLENDEFISGQGNKLINTTYENENKVLSKKNRVYGEEYTIRISGFASNAKQVKMKILANVLEDQEKNKSEEKEFILFNSLKETKNEKSNSSKFLGISGISRKNISGIEFTNNLELSNDKKTYDVSAMSDKSIIAWVEGTKIYIGSENIINANNDSSYLFANLGNEIENFEIINLAKLNFNNVSNMSHMFENFGYNSLEKFDLGSNFVTENVTDMSYMFNNFGYMKLKDFSFGSNFTTNKVTDMSHMFENFGYTSIENLKLPTEFNTSSVENYDYMFAGCGHENMFTLDLSDSKFDSSNLNSNATMNHMFDECGYTNLTSLIWPSDSENSFNTSNVISMNSMFKNFGYSKLVNLNIPSGFDTTKTEDMESMFEGCGNLLMENLNLDNSNSTKKEAKFSTQSAKNMSNMFKDCGSANLKSLYWGPAFTKIAEKNSDMLKNCGKENECTIYAAEKICSNVELDTENNAYKSELLKIESGKILNYSRGKILMNYYTEWKAVQSKLDYEKEAVEITIYGKCINTKYGNNTLNVDDINVKINGEDAPSNSGEVVKNSILKSLELTTSEENGVAYILKLSNFEQQAHQNSKEFLEWSGYIELSFASETLFDVYSNSNAVENSNSDAEIFADFIKPIVIYNDSEAVIEGENTYVTVNFDVVDKFYDTNQDELQITDLQFYNENGEKYTLNNHNAILTSQNLYGKVAENGNLNGETYVLGYKSSEKTSAIIGKRYTLTIKYFENQANENDLLNKNFSILVYENKVKDLSYNSNVMTAMTVNIEKISQEKRITKKISEEITEEKYGWEKIEGMIDRVKWNTEKDLSHENKVIVRVRLNNSANVEYELLPEQIEVFVNDELNTEIEKNVSRVDDETLGENVFDISLTNFENISGKTEIIILNNDDENEKWDEEYINVGGTETSNSFTAFSNGIVDFNSPKLEYTYICNNEEDQNNYINDGDSQENLNPVIIKNTENSNGKIKIKFSVLDNNLNKTISSISAQDLKIKVDGNDVTSYLNEKNGIEINQIETSEKDELQYEVILSNFENADNIDFSGKFEIEIPEGKIYDTSGNTSAVSFVVNDKDGNDLMIDISKPSVYLYNYEKNAEEKQIKFSVRVFDENYNENSKIDEHDIKIILSESNEDITKQFPIEITDEIIDENTHQFNILVKKYELEEKIKLSICENVITDNYGNTNSKFETEEILVDNQNPEWIYENIKLENNDKTKVGLYFKAQDDNIVKEKCELSTDDITIYKDGKEIYSENLKNENVNSVSIEKIEDKDNERNDEIQYKVVIDDIDEGERNYTLEIEPKVLVDSNGNYSDRTTLNFSNSVFETNEFEVTYSIKDYKKVVITEKNNTNNLEANKYYMPATIGELMQKDTSINKILAGNYDEESGNAQTFKCWMSVDEDGKYIDSIGYTAYEEIPRNVTNLKAVFVDANVVFVSNLGNDSNSGKKSTPVKTLEKAFEILEENKEAYEQIVVIMDEVSVDSDITTKLGRNATITSVYAGENYIEKNNAKLLISADVRFQGNVIFDDINVTDSDEHVVACNYNDLIIGRGVTTDSGKYTIGTIIGGNYKKENNTGSIGTHKLVVSRGKYCNIIAGSSLNNSTEKEKFVKHIIQIGSKEDYINSDNEKLTIDGYFILGENEKFYYAFNTENGKIQDANESYNLNYAEVKLYSGTFEKNDLDKSIYLRNQDCNIEGKILFEMFGGKVNGNIFAGTINNEKSATDIMTEMKFYGGEIATDANIFGQGDYDNYIGSTEITLTGNVKVNGNVYGGAKSNKKNEAKGKCDTSIKIVGSAVNVNGNIYGGSYSENNLDLDNGFIDGSTNISIQGSVNGNVYGGGYNTKISGKTNVNIINGQINKNVFGGSYRGEIGESTNINITGGTIGFDESTYGIYAGNERESKDKTKTYLSNANITVDGTNAIINQNIYGGGKFDKIEKNTIDLKCVNSSKGSLIAYGGSNTQDEVKESNIYLDGANVSEIYGGGNKCDNVNTSNIILKSGNVENVYGGGNEANVSNSNIEIDSNSEIIADAIYGGSKKSGTTENANITLRSGKLYSNIFGGGTESSIVQNSKITLLAGEILGYIYGGGNEANIGTDENKGSVVIDIAGGKIGDNNSLANIYGGCYGNGKVYGDIEINVGNNEVTLNPEKNENIDIYGNIFGAGKASNNEENVGVYGNITINVDGSNNEINIKDSIYGEGYYSTYYKNEENSEANNTATINIKNFGKGEFDEKTKTFSNIKILKSIQRATNVNISNSYIELEGKTNELNLYPNEAYTFNRIDNLTIAEGTNLCLQSGINLVYEYNSRVTLEGELEQVTLNAEDDESEESEKTYKIVEKNVDNRIYVTNGTNLIFAKIENVFANDGIDNIYAKDELGNWGKINGITYFGNYGTSGENKKSIIEAQHELNMNVYANENGETNIDGGFFTDFSEINYNEEKQEMESVNVEKIINPSPISCKYYDWTIGENLLSYNLKDSTVTYTDAYLADFYDDTDSLETSRIYTDKSCIEMKYKFNYKGTNVYDNDDYRVVASKIELPENTVITLTDKNTKSSESARHYQYTIASGYTPDTVTAKDYLGDDTTFYIYEFTDFIETGCYDENSKYVNDNSRYQQVVDSETINSEEYALSIDFKNADIEEIVNYSNNEIYVFLIDGADDSVKYSNIPSVANSGIIYYRNSSLNSVNTSYLNFDILSLDTGESIRSSSGIVLKDDAEVSFKLNADFLERNNVIDTTNKNGKVGCMIEILDSDGNRLDFTEISCKATVYKYTNSVEEKVGDYYNDENNTIRFLIGDDYGEYERKITLNLSDGMIDTDNGCKVKIWCFVSKDGLYEENATLKSNKYFKLQTFSDKVEFGIETNKRIINLEDEDEDFLIGYSVNLKNANEIVGDSNILAVQLYKRDATYVEKDGTLYYNDATYSLVDVWTYFEDLYEYYGIGNSSEFLIGDKEYFCAFAYNNNKTDWEESYELIVNENIPEGEYKVVFNVYSVLLLSTMMNDVKNIYFPKYGSNFYGTLVSSAEETFIVIK